MPAGQTWKQYWKYYWQDGPLHAMGVPWFASQLPYFFFFIASLQETPLDVALLRFITCYLLPMVVWIAFAKSILLGMTLLIVLFYSFTESNTVYPIRVPAGKLRRNVRKTLSLKMFKKVHGHNFEEESTESTNPYAISSYVQVLIPVLHFFNELDTYFGVTEKESKRNRITSKLGFVWHCINVMDEFSYRWAGFHLIRMQVKSLVAQAKRAEAPQFFGTGDNISDGVRLFCTSIYNSPAGVSATGKLIMNNYVRGQLHLRQQVISYITNHPDVLKVKLARPVIIMGLPRTGSTFLQKLMSLDPNARHLCFWEMTMPIPPPRKRTYETDPRIAMVAQGLDSSDLISKGFMEKIRKFHNIRSDSMEEELILLQHSMIFMSHYFLTGLNSPFYNWLMGSDAPHECFYQHLYRALQVLCSKYKPRSFLILKAPVHSLQPEALMKIFPDARIINTHRDPTAAISSWTKFQRQMLSIYVAKDKDIGNTQMYADMTLDMCVKMADRVMAYRDSHPEERWFDLKYKDLIAEPLKSLERVCAFHDIKFTPKWRSAVVKFLDAQATRTTGKQGGQSGERGLAELGLDEDHVRRSFANYTSRYLA
eukprot:gb/GEZN01004798.1/.p1 GENE.gb/GEZN01004798.1/~~gb/GEZN01004798.1/.p1  ORF type:complete len:612 (+),score=81.86 gb/GEZN01004798.1/:56-1837(+)